jgi:hypothetical protein
MVMREEARIRTKLKEDDLVLYARQLRSASSFRPIFQLENKWLVPTPTQKMVIKSGYHFQSWPLLRAGLEAAELMDYFRLHPEQIQSWLDKEKRFDSLSWVRTGLPNPELRQDLFNLFNETAHANLRNIDGMSSFASGRDERTLAVGPLPFSTKERLPLGFVALLISYPIRVLWLSNQDVVSSEWVSGFDDFDSEAGFPLREDTTATSVNDLDVEKPDTLDL